MKRYMSIYYQDESSFEISQKMWRILCEPGTKPRMKGKSRRHESMSISGAYSSEGDLIYRSSKWKKAKDFLKFLYQLRYKEKKKWIILVVDNASIHHAKVVKRYCKENNIKLVYLPAYSPEYNPIEFLRKRIKRMYQKVQRRYDSTMRWVQEATRRCRGEFSWFKISENCII
jgi:transposase